MSAMCPTRNNLQTNTWSGQTCLRGFVNAQLAVGARLSAGRLMLGKWQQCCAAQASNARPALVLSMLQSRPRNAAG